MRRHLRAIVLAVGADKELSAELRRRSDYYQENSQRVN